MAFISPLFYGRGSRNRTYDHGVKVHSLTAWLYPYIKSRCVASRLHVTVKCTKTIVIRDMETLVGFEPTIIVLRTIALPILATMSCPDYSGLFNYLRFRIVD